jgi:hypothetical protein
MVAVFDDLNAGRVVEASLKEKGFSARTYDDKLFRYFLFLRPPRVTFRVQVPKDRVGDVDEFWAADAPAALKRAIHCPACGSFSVSYPQMTRKFILPTVLLHLGIIFRVLDHECYCEHCHHTWNLSQEHVRAPRQAPQFPFNEIR